MATSTDSMQLESLMADKSLIIDPTQFAGVNQSWISDINNNNYSDSLYFTTQSLSSSLITISNMVLAIPIKISSNTSTSFTSNTKLGWKTSALSLISGVTVTSANSTLVSEVDNVGFTKAQILPHLTSNITDVSSQTSIYGYAGPDNSLLVSGSSSTNGTTRTTDPPASYSATARYNSALATRCNAVSRYFNPATSAFEMIVYIPLREIHSLFAQLNFPLINFPLQIQLQLSSFKGLKPLVYSSNSDVSPDYKIEYGNVLSQDVDGNRISSSRLYHQQIKLLADDQATYESMLKNGATKSLQYITSNLYKPQTTTGAVSGYGGNLINQTVSSSVVKPLRLFVHAGAVGHSTSITDLSNSGSARFTQTNVSINNVPFYSQNLLLDRELYSLVQESFTDTIVKYGDFVQGNYLTCFDFSRLQLADKNSACNVSFSASYASASGFDCSFVLDRLQTVEMTFGSSSVVAVVKSGV